MDKTEKQEALGKLKVQMEEDMSLPLRDSATNLVFGEGDADAKVMFIGEGPGYWEDQKARPFVGNAGAFLNQLLHSIELDRGEVFITNVVNFRPPDNRDPTPEEIGAFKPYIDKMIEIIQPKMMVTLGRFSMAKFVPGVKISNVHGKPHTVDWQGRRLMILPMYHPAAGLRSTQVKLATLEDFKKIPELMRSVNKVEIEQMSLM